MKSEKGGLLFLVIVGMELSWLYAWATFLTSSILHQPFPLPEVIGTFILASVLTLFFKGRGWRVASILGIQIIGFILATLRIVYVFNSWSPPFLSHTWLTEFFNTPRGPLEWFHLIFILFLALVFWIGGVTLARRSTAYSTLCSRFDLGITAFFLLFLTKLILLVKGGIKIEDHMSQLLLLSFFIFSLLAIGLVRNRSTTPRNFLPGYQGIGVILSFTVGVLLFGTGLVLFFLPYLTMSAEMGYGILKTAAKPLGYIFVEIIRFLYMPKAFRPETPSAPPGSSIGDLTGPTESGWWTELLEKILGWVFGGLIGVVILIVFGIAVFYLIRWLFSKTPISQRRQSSWYLISLWLERLRIFLFSWLRRIVHRMKGYKRAAQLYTALLNWGRHSGLPHFLSETPIEYGFRLENRFPSLRAEIELIIEAFNQEVYGEIALREQQLDLALFAWRRLRSPLHWPSRLKTWFLMREDHPL
jgi:hypothetical protein